MNWKFWEKSEKEKAPKSKGREWFDAILFAVVAATLIRWLIMEAYTIPTPSMENTLLVDDFLFVSKFHYGTRTTTTPLQVPLTHQKIWFTNIPSYLDWIRLPQYRLPGISHINREDVVVFNVPPTDLNEGIEYPPDLKTNYIKRCVGIAGDTLVIKDKQVYANGVALTNPENMQYRYQVVAKGMLNDRFMDNYDLRQKDIYDDSRKTDGIYEFCLTKETAEALKKNNYISSVEIAVEDKFERGNPTFPYCYRNEWAGDTLNHDNWSADNYGPLWIPKEGATIDINPEMLAIYGHTITTYDHNDNAKVEGGKLYIDGQEVTKYTFKQNYYFMMGDNRHNSLDSRYWGFVPEDHIVGKAFFIWLSIDRDASFLHKIRWNRFLKMIH